jgi:hypothetical protein
MDLGVDNGHGARSSVPGDFWYPMISGIAAGSRFEGNARCALLLRGSRVGIVKSCSARSPDVASLIRAASWSAVIASGAKQSIARRKEMDCFAPLAMTQISRCNDVNSHR